jgi:2'-5' RNA ligase
MPEFFVAFDVPEPYHKFRKDGVRTLLAELGLRCSSGRTPAHVTLKAPFKVPEQEVPALPVTLEAIIRRNGLRGVQAGVGSVSHFNERVIILRLKGRPLRKITTTIIDNFETFGVPRTPGEGKVPHMTLVKDLSSTEHFDMARGALSEMTLPCKTIDLTDVVLWEKFPEGWSEKYRVSLM